MANTDPDALTKVVDKTKEFTASASASVQKPRRDDNPLEKIEKLSETKDKDIISEEEFNEKKAALSKKSN